MRYSDRAAAVLLAALTAVLAGGRPAHAQGTAEGRAYVSGGVIGDIKRFSGDVAEPRFDGEALGGSLTIGTSVHPRWDLQLGIDVPRFTATSRDRPVTFQRTIITLQSVTENQTLSVAALARFHGATRGRFQLGYLAGLSVVRFRRNSRTDAPPGTPDALIPMSDESVGYAAGPTLGVDVRVEMSPHLSVVPALHATVFRLTDTSGVALRPRVAVRWTF